MKKLQRITLSLAALLLFSGVALVVPASARPVSAQTADNNNQATAADTGSAGGNTLAEQFRAQAKQKLQQIQATHKAKTEAEREKVCAVRKSVLTKRMANAVAQAKKHKQVFDKIYAEVKNFYTAKNLSVSNYADLTAKADTASAGAQTGIDALAALDVNVDCTSQTVASSVSAFQSAVKSTHDSLKAYRSAITDLITAIKGASTGTTDSSTNDVNQ